MHRSTPCSFVLLVPLAALLVSGCGSSPTDPTDQPEAPVEIVEPNITGTLTVNGAGTHVFVVGRAGNASATLTSLLPDSAAVIGLSLGTWNGAACQIIIANTNATQNTSVIGTASSAGNFCAYVQDVGKLTQPVDYELLIRHF